MPDEPINIVTPTASDIRAQQKVIINAFKLTVPEYMPAAYKEGVETVENISQLGASIKGNSAMTAGVAIVKSTNQEQTDNKFTNKVNPTQIDTPLPGKTQLGTAVWTNLIITGESYIDPVTDENIVIPTYTIYTCLIELSGSKDIIKTMIQGRNGTIKDYIATNDWEINIKGGIFGLNGQRPKQDINTLKRALWTANISLGVKAPIFDEWDITNMVVEDIRVPEQMGGYSYQIFEIKAASDPNLILNLSGL